MINLQTLLSTFDEKGTLLKWLKKVEAALANASLETVQLVVVDATHIKMKLGSSLMLYIMVSNRYMGLNEINEF